MADFSISDPTIRTFLSYYASSKDQVLIVLPLAVVVRSMIALQGGVESQVAVMKDAAICVMLLIVFYQFIGVILGAPDVLTRTLGLDQMQVNVNPTRGDWFSLNVALISRFISFWAYIIAKGVYYISILILIVLAAYAIFLTSMTSSYRILMGYGALLILVSMIPALWTLINLGTSKLFDEKDPDWNNGMIMLGSFAKVFLAWVAFKRALYEPFLKNITSALTSAVKTTAKAGAMASGSGAVAKAGYVQLGGKHHVDAASNKISKLKGHADRNLKKTIPGIEKALKKQYGNAKSLHKKARSFVSGSANPNAPRGAALPHYTKALAAFANSEVSTKKMRYTNDGVIHSSSKTQRPSLTLPGDRRFEFKGQKKPEPLAAVLSSPPPAATLTSQASAKLKKKLVMAPASELRALDKIRVQQNQQITAHYKRKRFKRK